jgi:glucose/arabinose dehydrogenase
MDVPSVWRPKLLLVALAGACIWSYPTLARAEGSGEAEWIWGAAEDEQLPSACWFRKTFDVPEVESARVQITADDRFELFVNGRRVGTGKDWKVLASYDIRKFLVAGRNAIAVKAENLSGKTAGVVAQVTVKQPGHTDVSYSTDASWRVSTHEVTGWERARFNDATWPAAHSFGELGSAAPWGDQITSADGSPIKRFRVARDFRIERVLRGSMTGSLIAMTFNEWGEILASREGGPLELMIDRNQDGVPDTVTVYCDQVKNTQGILALNGEVFVVATGPQGAGLYRLNDDDRDGKADKVQRLVEFAGEMTEHGPHVPVLGPDGLLYVMLGNHTAVKKSFDPQSPYHRFYEGDLPQPKYEDPNLDAAGVKAPGGMVIRTDTEGSFVQLFAGGLRNAYDMAFTPRGDLLTCDSDMEWDIGTPWYRPTRVLQLAAGGEFGWRSGWSCWPDYYLDGLPTTLDTGRGSPAGIETYDHWAYPPQYHDTLFVADWSQGRITAVHLKPEGAGYEARSEVFLEGRPLNVTDLAVGPDGALYFSTGGRGTEGGIYRIVWNGKAIVPEIKDPILRAVRQPQIASAWARQKIAGIQEQLGDQWGPQLTDLIEDTSARADDRCRAMQMTQLYGPAIDGKMLARLCQDKQVVVRAKAAWLLGLTPDQTSAKALFRLMNDPDALVRASAIEAINRGVYDVPIDRLVVRLADTDRHVAWAARRTLEEFPVEDWKQKVLGAKETRAFLVGAVALLAVEPDRKSAEAIVERGRTLMQGYLSDPRLPLFASRVRTGGDPRQARARRHLGVPRPVGARVPFGRSADESRIAPGARATASHGDHPADARRARRQSLGCRQTAHGDDGPVHHFGLDGRAEAGAGRIPGDGLEDRRWAEREWLSRKCRARLHEDVPGGRAAAHPGAGRPLAEHRPGGARGLARTSGRRNDLASDHARPRNANQRRRPGRQTIANRSGSGTGR